MAGLADIELERLSELRCSLTELKSIAATVGPGFHADLRTVGPVWVE